MPNPLTLTFSTEIECIVCIDAAKYEKCLSIHEGTLRPDTLSPHDKLKLICRNLLIDRFNNHGLRTSDPHSRPGTHQWTVAPAPAIQLNPNLRADGFQECAVAISSPLMRLCDRALRRVEHAVQILGNEFDTFVNESCGFHVRIGNAGDGFPLQTVKNLCMLTKGFEHQIDSLHPGHRVGNPRAKGPGKVFRGRNPWDAVERIQRCRGVGELVGLYEGGEGGGFAYNLGGLGEGGGSIEFRQHEGSLDWGKMGNWVGVVGGLVEAANRISVERVADLIARCGFERRFTVFDLWERLGLEGLREFYLGRMYVHVRAERVWVRGKGEGGKRGMGWRRKEFERRLEWRREVGEGEAGEDKRRVVD